MEGSCPPILQGSTQVHWLSPTVIHDLADPYRSSVPAMNSYFGALTGRKPSGVFDGEPVVTRA
jgi:hypothetical protein